MSLEITILPKVQVIEIGLNVALVIVIELNCVLVIVMVIALNLMFVVETVVNIVAMKGIVRGIDPYHDYCYYYWYWCYNEAVTQVQSDSISSFDYYVITML